MSLINPKHLLSPFKNTTHVVTIIFVVFLFGVYRLAFGKIEFSDASAPRSFREDINSDESKKAETSKDLGEIEKELGIR